MLAKMINLNIKQIRGEIASSCFIFTLAFSSVVLSTNSLLDTGYVGIAAVMMIKGYCKIFCDRVYRDDAAMYMTLPVTNEMVIWAKVLTCAIWAALMQISAVTGTSLGMMFFDRNLSFLVERVAGEYQTLGMSPLQVGIVVGFRPFALVVFTVTICFFVMTVQSLFSRRGINKRKSVLVVVGMILSGGIIFGTDKLTESYGEKGLDYLLLQACFLIILIMLNVLMYSFCRKDIERR